MIVQVNLGPAILENHRPILRRIECCRLLFIERQNWVRMRAPHTWCSDVEFCSANMYGIGESPLFGAWWCLLLKQSSTLAFSIDKDRPVSSTAGSHLHRVEHLHAWVG